MYVVLLTTSIFVYFCVQHHGSGESRGFVRPAGGRPVGCDRLPVHVGHRRSPRPRHVPHPEPADRVQNQVPRLCELHTSSGSVERDGAQW